MSSNPILGAAFGLLAFVVVGFAAALGYLFLMGGALDRHGLENVGAIVTLPMFALFAGGFWVALDWILSRRRGPVSPGRAAGYGALIGLGFSLVIAGPQGFGTTGGSAFANYFLIAVTSGGAWLHRLLASRAER
ncbi:MAG: hypothetical protein GC160_12695 [Acidobacteria bacterium]|nr:hypothetical protein [Acidobacteriota bacterium]